MSTTPPASPDGPPRAALNPFRAVSSLVRLDVSALSHCGRVRPNNEDQFFVSKLTRSLETMLTTLPPGDVPTRVDDVNYVMIVADGMGGHASGEVASRMAIGVLVSLALEVPDWIFRVDAEHAQELEWRARRIVQQVNTVLREVGHRDAALRGMGTTLTAARSLGRDLVIVHVGDSRAYLFRLGHLHRLTKDHTYAQLLVDTGELAESNARSSRLRHILTNAVGGSAEQVDVDIDLVRLEENDRLLLCSDGLTDQIGDDAIETTLSQSRESSEACSRLVRLALDAGGHDNVTAIVAAYSFGDERAVDPVDVNDRR